MESLYRVRPLWRGENVSINQLWEDFCTYLYLPRLRDENVLLEAIAHGIGLLLWESESFAYAEGWDESRRRYLGLLAGQTDTIGMGSRGMLVKPEAALAQLERDRAEEAARHGAEPREHVSAAPGTPPSDDGLSAGAAGTMTRAETAVPILRRFHGSVRLDTLRMGRDAGQIAEEIVTLLSNQPGARVAITLEIEAELPDGAPGDVVRTVTENAATLKFSTQGFEEE